LQAPGCLARVQVDYARAIWSARPGDPRALELLDAAAEAAQRHGLGAVARKVAALRAESGSPV
jgi:DNA-binding transcriptional regulator YbjK